MSTLRLANHRILTGSFLIGCLVYIFAGARVVAQEGSPIRMVSNSSLPTGKGLAVNFRADSDINSHPDVIFADGFEVGELGAHWDEVRNDRDEVLAFEQHQDSTSGLGKRGIKVIATLGKDTGGGFTKWFESADRLFIRFYTKFDLQCDYVHHFCTLRANRGLRGADRWSGFGGAGLRPDGEQRFSTAIEPWGNWGEWPAPGRWNFYSYWHSMKPSRDGKYWGNNFFPPEQPIIEKGKWICVEFMILHNTPGVDDGEQAYWIDGELQGHWTGFNWRTDERLQANALTMESYITDRWTKQPQNIVYFDNVVVAKSYIGPVSQ